MRPEEAVANHTYYVNNNYPHLADMPCRYVVLREVPNLSFDRGHFPLRCRMLIGALSCDAYLASGVSNPPTHTVEQFAYAELDVIEQLT